MTPSDLVDPLFHPPGSRWRWNDTIVCKRNQRSFCLNGYLVYAGTGADSVLIANGENLAIYADASAADTAGGADS